MSWAAHNPEAYDEIIRKGIDNYLCRTITEQGFEFLDLQPIMALVEAIQEIPALRRVYNELLDLASRDIISAEQDYFSRLHGE